MMFGCALLCFRPVQGAKDAEKSEKVCALWKLGVKPAEVSPSPRPCQTSEESLHEQGCEDRKTETSNPA